MRIGKLIYSLTTVALLTAGFEVLAQPTVTITGQPVVVTKSGDYYVVPAGTPTTTTYYSYSDSGVNYVCTQSTPAELSGLTPTTISISASGAVSQVSCFPSSYFIVQ